MQFEAILVGNVHLAAQRINSMAAWFVRVEVPLHICRVSCQKTTRDHVPNVLSDELAIKRIDLIIFVKPRAYDDLQTAILPQAAISLNGEYAVYSTSTSETQNGPAS